MAMLRFHKSGRTGWTPQKQPLDPVARRAMFGPIQPMEEDSRFSLAAFFRRH